MKKQKERLNANNVDADLVSAQKENKGQIWNLLLQNPKTKFQTLTSNAKGITLIALIITIIVMLILVGVTINVALDGGLFGKAREGANKTQIEADRETLLSAVIGAIGENAEVDFTVLDSTLPNGFIGSNGTYTSKIGNTFIVDEYGNITLADEDLLSLIRYFLGDNFEGKNIYSLTEGGYLDETTIFKDDKLTIPNASSDLRYLTIIEPNDGITEFYVYLGYKSKVYKLSTGYEWEETLTAQKVEFVYEPHGREGKLAKYDSNDDGTQEEWMILYDNGNDVEIIPINSMGEKVTIGKDDEEAQGNTDLDRSIYSYNNAIKKLNEYCASLITNNNKISVRSVGSNPNNPSSENSALYKSDKLAQWYEGRYNGVVKGADKNYEQDYVRMSYWGVAKNGQEYFLASRGNIEYDDHVNFFLWISYDGAYDFGDVVYISSRYQNRGGSFSRNVRPVVKVSPENIQIEE